MPERTLKVRCGRFKAGNTGPKQNTPFLPSPYISLLLLSKKPSSKYMPGLDFINYRTVSKMQPGHPRKFQIGPLNHAPYKSGCICLSLPGKENLKTVFDSFPLAVSRTPCPISSACLLFGHIPGVSTC